MSNNCEHFACWCRYNVKISSQVIQIYVLLFVRSSMGLTIRHLSIRIFFQRSPEKFVTTGEMQGVEERSPKWEEIVPPVLRLFFCLFILLTACLRLSKSIHTCIYLQVSHCLSVCMSLCMHAYQYIFTSICLFFNLFVNIQLQSACLSTSLFDCLSICLPVCRPPCLTACMPACLSVYNRPVRPSSCLHVYLSASVYVCKTVTYSVPLTYLQIN